MHPRFTPTTLDSNPIQVSRMNCPEDQNGCGKLLHGQSEDETQRPTMLGTSVPNNQVPACNMVLTFHFAFNIVAFWHVFLSHHESLLETRCI